MSRADSRVLAIVQARMSSTRLPGKVLEELGGTRVLDLVLQRLGAASELQGVVVATSTDPGDDPVAQVAADAGVPVVRGPLEDVLERYRLAAEQHPCEAVVRITADCPLVDPDVVDAVVRRWRGADEQYVANVIEPRTYPKGLDVEVISRTALEAAAAEASDAYDREHVTPYVRSRPDTFPQARVTHEPSYGGVRLTLDTPEDLEALRALVDRVGPDARMGELMAALETEAGRP
jgi:spore coat polysaccharide biosynthesis protein SpsF